MSVVRFELEMLSALESILVTLNNYATRAALMFYYYIPAPLLCKSQFDKVCLAPTSDFEYSFSLLLIKYNIYPSVLAI